MPTIRCEPSGKGSLYQRLMQYAAVHTRQRYAGEECQCRRDVRPDWLRLRILPERSLCPEEQGNPCIVVVTGAVRRPSAFADQPIWLRDDDDVARSIWIVPVGQSPQECVAAAAGVRDFITRISRVWTPGRARSASRRAATTVGRVRRRSMIAGLEIDDRSAQGPRFMLARSQLVEYAFNSLGYESCRRPAGVQSCGGSRSGMEPRRGRW